jgi:hypothetical protein
MNGGWRHEDFAARLGEQVTLHALDGLGRSALATVATCSDVVRTGDFVSYNVTFLAEPEVSPKQAVFLIEASGRDPEPIFLVPLRDVGGRVEYEAVFNQVVDIGSRP